MIHWLKWLKYKLVHNFPYIVMILIRKSITRACNSFQIMRFMYTLFYLRMRRSMIHNWAVSFVFLASSFLIIGSPACCPRLHAKCDTFTSLPFGCDWFTRLYRCCRQYSNFVCNYPFVIAHVCVRKLQRSVPPHTIPERRELFFVKSETIKWIVQSIVIRINIGQFDV